MAVEVFLYNDQFLVLEVFSKKNQFLYFERLGVDSTQGSHTPRSILIQIIKKIHSLSPINSVTLSVCHIIAPVDGDDERASCLRIWVILLSIHLIDSIVLGIDSFVPESNSPISYF